MRNTLLVETDLIYAKNQDSPAQEPNPDLDDDGLVEIGFEDMEPIAGFDVVGCEPHTAIAILPFLEFDMVGVAPYGAVAVTPTPAFPRTSALEPDAVPTEEFSTWDDRQAFEGSVED